MTSGLTLYSTTPSFPRSKVGMEKYLMPMMTVYPSKPVTYKDHRLHRIGKLALAPDRNEMTMVMRELCYPDFFKDQLSPAGLVFLDSIKSAACFKICIRHVEATRHGLKTSRFERVPGTVAVGLVTTTGQMNEAIAVHSAEPEVHQKELKAVVERFLPMTLLPEETYRHADLSQLPIVVDLRNQSHFLEIGDMVASPYSCKVKYKLLGYTPSIENSSGRVTILPQHAFYIGRQSKPHICTGWPKFVKNKSWPNGLSLLG